MLRSLLNIGPAISVCNNMPLLGLGHPYTEGAVNLLASSWPCFQGQCPIPILVKQLPSPVFIDGQPPRVASVAEYHHCHEHICNLIYTIISWCGVI